MMSRKRDAKCDSKFQYLWLRNGIFYYRIELPRVEGKRRYKRISLHTGNFYEAREKIKNMSNPENTINKLSRLFNSLIFETGGGISGSYNMVSTLPDKKRLSKQNKREDIEELYWLYTAMHKEISSLRAENKALIDKVESILPQLQEFMARTPITVAKTPAPPSRTISEVLESMLFIGNNCESEQIRKRNTITKLLATVSLKVEDDYSKFHTSSTINAISRHIVALTDTKGDMKRKLIRYIKELATCGFKLDPDNYKQNVIFNLPKVQKTKKAEKKPHLPYSEAQLLEIFDPKHKYFRENFDAFFACLIALYTGARANSAITLQYNDIMVKDGIHCIKFINNDPIKQLKNDASLRIVPIHSQLLEVGFVDYVRRNQKLLNAKGTDFIFPRCKTKNGLYNNKYTVRYVLDFFKSIGVKSGSKDCLDFHSFRKNASLALQKARIIPSYINDIIGWEGKSTMESAYSNHTLAEIKAEMDKFSYDFLQPHLTEWKKILAEM